MTYTSTDIAMEIIQDLGLTDIAPGVIAFWVRNNIGMLNNLIYTSYSLDDTTSEISPGISIEAIAILKKMYEIQNINSVIRTNLGSSAWSATIEVSENGNRIRKTNKTELGKVYSELRLQTLDELKYLVNGYLQKTGGTSVLSVDGVDGSLPYTTYYPNDGYRRSRNY